MLVVFPVALFTAGLASLIAYRVTGDLFWFRAAYVAMLAGSAVAGLAIIAGAIDVFALPRDSREKSAGITHAGLAVATTILFTSAGFALRSSWNAHDPGAGLDSGLALILAIFGFGFLCAAGWFGWRMVAVHHVGVAPIPGKGVGVALPRPLTHAPHGAHGAHP
jgi:uncharacterized membrane protein